MVVEMKKKDKSIRGTGRETRGREQTDQKRDRAERWGRKRRLFSVS